MASSVHDPNQQGLYRHTQKGPWHVLLYALPLLFFVLAWVLRHEAPTPIILLTVGLLLLVFAPSFHHLTVADEGDRLAIRFGPLPLLKRRIRYVDIQDVKIGRTVPFIEGWGVHYSLLRFGWVWNIWGLDCVVIRLSRLRIIVVGTDDVENLAAFLKTKIGRP